MNPEPLSSCQKLAFVSQYPALQKVIPLPCRNLPFMESDSTHSHPWLPGDFSSPLRVADWKSLLSDPEFFSDEERQMMRRMLDFSRPATPQELAERYGECPSFYTEIADEIGISASSVIKHTTLFDADTYGFWPMWLEGQLMEVRPDAVQRRSYYCRDLYRWRLRPEVRTALEETDLSQIQLQGQPDTDTARYLRIQEHEENQNAARREQKRREAALRARKQKEKQEVARALSFIRYGIGIGALLLAALQIWLASRA